MDQKTVRELERELEEAIADAIIRRPKIRNLPHLPSRHTLRMMAKAAVAVYEAAVENQRPED